MLIDVFRNLRTFSKLRRLSQVERALTFHAALLRERKSYRREGMIRISGKLGHVRRGVEIMASVTQWNLRSLYSEISFNLLILPP